MSRVKIIKEKRVANGDVITDVLELLLENDITFNVTEADSESDTITIEIEYNRQEREAVSSIYDMTDEYDDDDDE